QMAISPLMLDTPSEGLVGLTEDGRIAWMNSDAARLLGQPSWQGPAPRPGAENPADLDTRPLLGVAGFTEPVHLRLPNGLGVWVRSRAPRQARYASHGMAAATSRPGDNGNTPLSHPHAALVDPSRQNAAAL